MRDARTFFEGLFATPYELSTIANLQLAFCLISQKHCIQLTARSWSNMPMKFKEHEFKKVEWFDEYLPKSHSACKIFDEYGHNFKPTVSYTLQVTYQ